MESNTTSIEEFREKKALQFLEENSPTIDNFDDYLEEKRQKLREGNAVWAVRNIDTVGRYYDLIHPRGYIVAGIEFDGGEMGFNTYSLYVQNGSQQAIIFARMSILREMIDPDNVRASSTEHQVLGELLVAADEYMQTLEN